MSKRGRENMSERVFFFFFLEGMLLVEGTGQVMLQNYPKSLNDFLYAFPRLQKVRGENKNKRKRDTTKSDIKRREEVSCLRLQLTDALTPFCFSLMTTSCP